MDSTFRAWFIIICSAFSFWYFAIFSSIAGTSTPATKSNTVTGTFLVKMKCYIKIAPAKLSEKTYSCPPLPLGNHCILSKTENPPLFYWIYKYSKGIICISDAKSHCHTDIGIKKAKNDITITRMIWCTSLSWTMQLNYIPFILFVTLTTKEK